MDLRLYIFIFSLLSLNQVKAQCRLVKDLNPGTASGQVAFIKNINDKIYFHGTKDGVNHRMFEYTDSITGVREVEGDYDLFEMNSIKAYKNAIYFEGHDPVYEYQLWKYDGSGPAHRITSYLNNGYSFRNYYGAEYRDKLVFTVSFNNDSQVFEYDGVNDPYQISSFTGNNPIYGIFVFKDTLFINRNGEGFWKYDGTHPPALLPFQLGGIQQILIEFDSCLYMNGADLSGIRELWKFDGISPPEEVVRITSPTYFDPNNFCINNDTLWGITAYNNAVEIWNLIGDTIKTHSIPWSPGPGNSVGWLTSYKDTLYLVGQDSDGTKIMSYSNGVFEKIPLRPGMNSYFPEYLTSFKEGIFFSGYDTVCGAYELFCYPGKGYKAPALMNCSEQEFKIYPNPTNGVTNISFTDFCQDKVIQILIYNSIGQEVYKGEPLSVKNQNMQINLENLNSGMYLFKIKIGKEIKYRRICLE